MGNIENKLVWQPILSPPIGTEFQIILDRKFALGMLNSKITFENQNSMNNTAIELLENLKIKTKPYVFYENSCLVKTFQLFANGAWLTGHNLTEDALNENNHKPVIYYSHNIERSYQVLELISAFSLWVDYADNLKGFANKKKS